MYSIKLTVYIGRFMLRKNTKDKYKTLKKKRFLPFLFLGKDCGLSLKIFDNILSRNGLKQYFLISFSV